jgi:Zn-dependent metalloprotease
MMNGGSLRKQKSWICLIGVALIILSACQLREHATPAESAKRPQSEPISNSQKSETMKTPPYLEIDFNANGTPSRVKSDDLAASLASNPAFDEARKRNDHAEMVFLCLEHYSEFFKLVRPRQAMRIDDIRTDTLGSAHVRLQQVIDQIPVSGKMAIAHFNRNGALYLFQGDYIPSERLRDVPTQPRITESDASEKALAAASSPGSTVQEASLVVFVTEAQAARLAFKIVVAKGLMERNGYFVDAIDGRLLHKTSLLMH